MTVHGVHRRALVRAVKAAWWLEPDQDAAAIRATADLADMLDELRRNRSTQASMLGHLVDTKEAWHAASVHAKFQNALEQLRLTPSTRPEQVTDEASDLISELKATLRDV